MTILVRAQTRRRRLTLVASLGLALASACDDSKPGKGGEANPETPPSTAPTSADEPDGLGLEDGQLWRLEFDGEAPLAGRYGGNSVHALRKQDALSLSLEGQDTDLGITLEHVPVGQTGRYPAAPARFQASAQGLDCGTVKGGSIKVNLTHNEVGRVAGRIEGNTGCKEPSGSSVRWSGAFDYSGTIELR